jgi:hexosaminidase
VESMFKEIQRAVNNKPARPMGVIIAGWADAGLHPETFWLGYITGTAIAWNLAGSDPANLSRRFYESFYGPTQYKMDSIYRLLSRQAEFFDLSWRWVPSDLRKPILGNSEGMYTKPRKAEDQTIPLLPVPSASDLSIPFDWDSLNKSRLDSVAIFAMENNSLMQWLKKNLPSKSQGYNIEVLQTVALLCKQNLTMISDLSNVNGYLKKASQKAAAKNPSQAIGFVDSALNLVGDIKMEREAVLAHIEDVWYKEWMPLVLEANGRHFLQAVDDIKDHQPVRTYDLSYLFYRQLNYPLGKWTDSVKHNRDVYAHLVE